MKQPVIIVTVGHSGSSGLMAVLSARGLAMGTSIKKTPQKNYQEHTFFQGINRKILGAQGYPYPWNPSQRMEVVGRYADSEKKVMEIRARAFTRMAEEGVSPLDQWGFKDPRTCLSFPFWIRVFPEAKLLFLNRKESDTAKGWHGLGDDGYYDFKKAFEENLAMAKELGMDVFGLSYDDLSDNWEETVKRLDEWLGFDAPKDAGLEKWKPKYDGKYR